MSGKINAGRIGAEGTVGELMAWVMPSLVDDRTPPAWPPDMFALSGAVLQKSGAYALVVGEWPPDGLGLTEWVEMIAGVGTEWRNGFPSGVPSAVQDWWNIVLAHVDSSLAKVQSNKSLCGALLQLLAAADEASANAGIPHGGGGKRDAYEEEASGALVGTRETGASLCQKVDRSKIRVLPKQHTPRSGITMRSLTHHLALCPATDIVPHWITTATDIEAHCLNILLVPWPLKVVPAQFGAASPSTSGLVDRYGFFTYDPRPVPARSPSEEIPKIVQSAEDSVGRIDGVILPELALTADEHKKLRDVLVREGRFLVCGVCQPCPTAGPPGRNYLVFDIPVAKPIDFVEVEQDKHHRWRLDRSQIIQYSLGRQLDPTKEWWEYIALRQRELNFVTIKDWLTLCVLVCEDLARPDPVGDLVRAVGPNLVIALLMDGPQLAARWPGRYATVLADDPGSSVLTLSSIGMVNMCRPPTGIARSRAVALWKDAKNREPLQIDLPDGAEGIVVTLTRDRVEEFTADGRSDHCQTAYPALSGIHIIRRD